MCVWVHRVDEIVIDMCPLLHQIVLSMVHAVEELPPVWLVVTVHLILTAIYLANARVPVPVEIDVAVHHLRLIHAGHLLHVLQVLELVELILIVRER